MSNFAIDEIVVPDSLDDADEFVEMVALRNLVEAGILGTDAFANSPAELLPYFRDNPQRVRRHFVARVDGRMIGRSMLTRSPRSDADEAELNIDVLTSHRERGVGTALLAILEQGAAALGRGVLQSTQPHTATAGGSRIAAPTGFGDLPAGDPGVRFLLRNGYALELVARICVLDLAGSRDAVALQRRLAEQHAGPGYRVHTWTGDCPPEWLDDIAVLLTGMSTDAPMAGMQVAEDVWDAERVRQRDARQREGGGLLVTSAAEHVPSGLLVAFTEASVPLGEAQPVGQGATLVLRGHRGHRLGLLLKAANIQQLLVASPTATVISTVNAEDNVAMLAVNDALGFRSLGLEGSWQKTRPL